MLPVSPGMAPVRFWRSSTPRCFESDRSQRIRVNQLHMITVTRLARDATSKPCRLEIHEIHLFITTLQTYFRCTLQMYISDVHVLLRKCDILRPVIISSIYLILLSAKCYSHANERHNSWPWPSLKEADHPDKLDRCRITRPAAPPARLSRHPRRGDHGDQGTQRNISKHLDPVRMGRPDQRTEPYCVKKAANGPWRLDIEEITIEDVQVARSGD